jgi:hypothetical protein
MVQGNPERGLGVYDETSIGFLRMFILQDISFELISFRK